MTDIPFDDLDRVAFPADASAGAIAEPAPRETFASAKDCSDHSLGERLVALVTGRCSKTGKLISEAGL
jgi:hypothetical protein